jgi:hypothetical protein
VLTDAYSLGTSRIECDSWFVPRAETALQYSRHDSMKIWLQSNPGKRLNSSEITVYGTNSKTVLIERSLKQASFHLSHRITNSETSHSG